MSLRKIIMLIVVLTTGFTSLFAQKTETKFQCGFDEIQQQIWKENPSLKVDYEKFLKNFESYESEVINKRGTKKYIIPVVFHVLHQNGAENISDAQIKDQIAILNRDFNKKNDDTTQIQAEFKNIIANCNFEFRLAKKDPLGNNTTGIEHIYSNFTNNAGPQSKINQWNRNQYLNVWVVKQIGVDNKLKIAGNALQPFGASFDYKLDGVLICYDYIGSIDQSSVKNSRTLTHEVGHYLGLSHVWGNTNSPEVSCGDDGVKDTPTTKGHQNQCLFTSTEDPITCNSDIYFQYKMDSVKVNSGIIDPTPLSKIDSANFKFFKAFGVSDSSKVTGAFAFKKWGTGGLNKDTVFANQTGAIDTTKYYEFSVSGKYKYLLSLDKITFKTFRDSNGIKSFAVRSSIDNFKNNLSVTASDTNNTKIKSNTVYIKRDTTKSFLTSIVLDKKQFVNFKSNKNITFRIYAWNAEKENGIFGVDSVTIFARSAPIENIENYMDYSYCHDHMFTEGQATLMRFFLESPISSRNNLSSETNLKATGVYDTITPVNTVPIADFYLNVKKNKDYKEMNVCSGDPLIFNDISYNGAVTSRKWIFENGTPATDTTKNPEVVFTSAGGHYITLIVSNNYGSDTLRKYIFVTGLSSVSGELIENFNSGFSWDWRVEDYNVNSSRFDLSATNGKSNSKCLKLDNYRDITKYYTFEEGYQHYNRLEGTIHSIMTPAINLSTTKNVTVSFDYAFATDSYSDTITDKLNVYRSTNCGEKWDLIHTIGGPKYPVVLTGTTSTNTLLTAGNSSGTPFLPQSDNLWKNSSIKLPVGDVDTRTRIKFEFIPSKKANNFYIDNLAITGTLEIEESPITKMNINVYPNPTSSSEGITIGYLANNENVTFELIDVQGKTLTKVVNTSKNILVKHTFDTNNLEIGCYFVKATQGSFTSTYKVVVF